MRKIYPYLFIATMHKYLTPEQLITYRGGDFAKIQWKDRPRHSRKLQNLYNRLVLEVLLGLGLTTPPGNAAEGGTRLVTPAGRFGHRTRSYTDLCPQVDHNPYLRLKMGEAMWMLWTACVHQMLPALNFLVVRKNEKFNIPRGGLFHWWAELYGTSRGYVEFCQAQQKLCVDLLDAGLLQIVVPPHGVLRGLGALGQARTIRDLVRGNKVDLLDETLAAWGIGDRTHAVMDAQAILGETFGVGLALQHDAKVLADMHQQLVAATSNFAEVARNETCADPSDPRNANNWPLCVRCGAPCEQAKTRAGENYPECDVTFAEEGHMKFVAGVVVRTRNFCGACEEEEEEEEKMTACEALVVGVVVAQILEFGWICVLVRWVRRHRHVAPSGLTTVPVGSPKK